MHVRASALAEWRHLYLLAIHLLNIFIFLLFAIMIVISVFLQNLIPATSSFSSPAFIFIVLQKLLGNKQFNLFVTILTESHV